MCCSHRSGKGSHLSLTKSTVLEQAMAWWVTQLAFRRLVPCLVLLISALESGAAVALVHSAPYLGRRQDGSLRVSGDLSSSNTAHLGLFSLVQDLAQLMDRRSRHDVIKRAVTHETPEYTGDVKYDEYPVVVPKRTAVMLDRFMVALKNAIDGDRSGGSGGRPGGPGGPGSSLNTIVPDDRMDLQRRGQQKGRVYWRCYFNAVTCF